MIREASLHGRGNAKRLVNSTEVVEHEVQGYGVAQVLDF